MNWKFVGCQGLVIVGIVFLASLNNTDISDRMYVLRVVIISFLFVFLLGLHFQSCWRHKKKLKQQDQILNSSVEEIKTECGCIGGEVRRLKAEIEQLKSKKNEPLNSDRALIKDFYNFLLVKWAQEHKAPFTGKDYKDIEGQFEKYKKTNS